MQIVIGDIHGCYAELMDLLEKIGLGSDDQIIALGDIVDRGPDSEKVLAFFRDTPNAVSLMGNHERKHIRSARGQTRAALSQILVRQQLGNQYPTWLAFMEMLPRHLQLPDAILVHGFFEPGVPLDDQRDTVIVGTLSGEEYIQQKLSPPWYDHYTGPKPLVVGHHSYLGTGEPVIREGLFYGIDTGCVHGGKLTALVLPEFRIVSIPARADHWSVMRGSHLAMVIRKRSVLDVPLDSLLSCRDHGDEDNHARRVNTELEYVVPLADACRQLAVAVCERAAAQANAILDELVCLAEPRMLDEREQVAQFAQRVQNHPAASLLFKARKGLLDLPRLLEIAKTPRGLQMLAENLGLPAALPEPVTASPSVVVAESEGPTPSVITEFSGQYRFLSNFYPAQIEYRGKIYPSAEHLFQSRKAVDYAESERIRVAPSPGTAKRMGAACKARADWDGIRDDVMREVVELKFAQHPDLAGRLLRTGDAELVEGNTWDDIYWGRSLATGLGQNRLGVILMGLRAKLRANAQTDGQSEE